ncbi:MAG TPA: cytochrome c oxidase subunit 3 [Gemmatimonadales bacterium]|nr:cytochrome c oxidase subunit 3 [Gemmatimonadales bacterium]
MTAVRPALDASTLPTTTFSHRSLAWWGTVGFMAIEGTTLFIAVVAYFYLRRNFAAWPPEHILRPDLFWPTVQVILLLASLVPVVLADRAAYRIDVPRLRRWLLVALGFEIVAVVIRWQEFLALNVRWDTNAYGSVVWTLVGFHTTLLLVDVLETAVLLGILYSKRRLERHISDATDVTFYWYFLVATWIPLYVIVYLSPRFM